MKRRDFTNFLGVAIGLGGVNVGGLVQPIFAQPVAGEFNLKVFGSRGVVELATILMAVDTLTGGKSTVSNGGIANLVGSTAAMQPGAGVNTTNPLPAVGAEADVATNADTQFLRFSAQRPDLRILCNLVKGHYHIVGRRSAGIASVKDLKGKRVATFPKTSSAYYLFKELEMNGLSEKDVQIVYLAPSIEIPKALIEKRVDAMTLWEPFNQIAKDAMGADAVELKTAGVYFEYFNLNTTAEKLADPVKRKQMVQLIRQIIIEARRAKEQPGIAHDWIVKATKYDRGAVERSFHHHDFTPSIIDTQLDVLVDHDKWVGREENRPGRSREELAKLLDYSVFQEAAASLR
jgi:sulfonate transport system substrate-binding protein